MRKPSEIVSGRSLLGRQADAVLRFRVKLMVRLTFCAVCIGVPGACIGLWALNAHGSAAASVFEDLSAEMIIHRLAKVWNGAQTWKVFEPPEYSG